MNAMLDILIVLLLCSTYVYSQEQGMVTVLNGCNEPLLIRNEAGSWTSKRLNAGESAMVTFPYETPLPRVWALRGCQGTDETTCIDFYGTERQFYSLAEFNWKNGQLWYDISMVDGYTTGIEMEPFLPGNPKECTNISCRYDVNSCEGNKIVRNGQVVGCQNPDKDNESNYSRNIKRSCPDGYTWSKDDEASKYTCFANPNNGLKITFYC